MILRMFLNNEGRLRSGWWIALFFGVLTAMLLPLILAARDADAGVPIYQQAGVVIAASVLCQLLRRRPLGEMFGPADLSWPRELFLGALLGALLMLVPAGFLYAAGYVTFTFSAASLAAFGPAIGVLVAAGITEEVLFRGFLFQRLIDGLGKWPAQVAIASLFTLTHSDALKEIGAQGVLAGANIFLASLMFGLAFLRTRSLAMPLGLHLTANIVQGPVLGFGVSGDSDPGLLIPLLVPGQTWVTGGAFGLEASIPGLVCVLAVIGFLLIWPAPKVRSLRDGRA